MPGDVRDVDSRILLDERAALMGEPAGVWQVDGLEPLGVRVNAWPPATAKWQYLVRFRDLVSSETLKEEAK